MRVVSVKTVHYLYITNNNSKSLLHVLVAKRRERIRAHKFCTRLKSRRDAANGSRLVLQLFVL